MNPMDKTQRMNQLMDAYDALLTEKQRMMLTQYYQEDFSSAEIAENCQITRSAVSDHLKRSEKLLEEYETKLKLVEHKAARTRIYEQMRSLGDNTIDQYIKMLENIDI